MKRNIYSKKDAPLEGMLKKDAEAESKLRAEEMGQVIDLIGQDSTEEALPHIREKLAVEKAEQVEDEARKLNALDYKLKWSRTDFNLDPYRQICCKMLIDLVKKNKFPKGYHFRAVPTQKGIEMWILSKDSKFFGQGITLSHIPKYDLNALEVLVMQAENRIDKLEDERRPNNKQTQTKLN